MDLSKEVIAHRFAFDAVFNEADSNEAIHVATLRPLLAHVFNGGSATVFAFGQTGSGKTCTMAGHANPDAADGNATGLYALAAADTVDAAREGGLAVSISFFEVYRGQVLDLLGGREKLDVLEDGRGRVQAITFPPPPPQCPRRCGRSRSIAVATRPGVGLGRESHRRRREHARSRAPG